MSQRLVPMRPRDPGEPGRTASPLELFFDLVFVVAVSVNAVALHHELAEGHVARGVLTYLMVFFAIWWAWMNFTWFATAFDTDDWLYRVLTFVQMGGVLVVAGGVEEVYAEGELTVITLGYVVMRLAMVAQWLRASRSTGDLRGTTLRYAGGITAVQVLWVLRLLLPEDLAVASFLVLVAAELAVPVTAERGLTTPWHRHHITERYSLFTLILLGESLLASANAVFSAIHEGDHVGELVGLAVLALAVVASLWWIYFWPPHHHRIGSLAESLRYGYGHYFVFAAAGAVSAGIEVQVAALAHHPALSEVAVDLTVAVPIAVFILGVWLLAIRPHADRLVNVVVPAAALLVLLETVSPFHAVAAAVILAGCVGVLAVREPREPAGQVRPGGRR